MVIYTCIVLVTNEELIHNVLSWTWVHICAFVLGPVLFFASVSIFSSTSAFALSGIDYWSVCFFFFACFLTPGRLYNAMM